MKKRIFSLVLAIAFCVCLMLPASAVSVTEANVPDLEVTAQAVNPLSVNVGPARAGCAGYISGGYGQLTCTLGRSISGGYVQAAVSYGNSSGIVDCFVKLPNGAIQSLGAVSATGGSTPQVPIYSLPAGDYTFMFQCTTTAQLYVSATISEP